MELKIDADMPVPEGNSTDNYMSTLKAAASTARLLEEAGLDITFGED